MTVTRVEKDPRTLGMTITAVLDKTPPAAGLTVSTPLRA